MLSKKNLRLTR